MKTLILNYIFKTDNLKASIIFVNRITGINPGNNLSVWPVNQVIFMKTK